MASNDEIESRNIVRMYSWEVEERIPNDADAHILGEAISQEAGPYEPQRLAAPWYRFFEPTDEPDSET